MNFRRTAQRLTRTTAALCYLGALTVGATFLVRVRVAEAEGAGSNPPAVDVSHPLTEAECVRLALQRNYSILESKDRLGQARANVMQAYGAFFPSLRAGYDYTHSVSESNPKPNDPAGVSANGVFLLSNKGKADQRGYSVSADQTLFSVASLLQIAAEKKLKGASELDVRTAEDVAVFAVRSQYYSLIQAIKLLDVRQEDFRLSQEELRRTESLFEVGSVARTDVLKSKVRVAEAQTAVTTAENSLQLERAKLSVALALPATTTFDVDTDLTPRSDLPDSAATYQLALDQRPDLDAASLRLDAAGRLRKAAYAAKLPTVFHSYNRSFTTSPGTLSGFKFTDTGFDRVDVPGKTVSSSWSYSIGVSVSLLDGLVTVSNINRAKHSELQARHALEDARLGVGLEVRGALLSLRAARAAVASAQEGLVSAEEDLKLSQERYNVGLGTILELIDARAGLTRARTTLVQAQATVKVAEAGLDKAIGRRSW